MGIFDPIEDKTLNQDVYTDLDIDKIIYERIKIMEEVEDLQKKFVEHRSMINQRETDLTQPKIERIKHLDQALERHLKNRKTRRAVLPSGDISLRKNPPSVKIVDEKKALKWVETYLPAAAKTVTKIDKNMIKKNIHNNEIVTTEGELIGIESTPFELPEPESKLKVTPIK